MSLRFEELSETLVAEHLAVGVYRIDDAVREEDDEVAGLGGEGELFVLGVGKEAKREAFSLDGSDGGGVGYAGVGGDEERLDRACIGSQLPKLPSKESSYRRRAKGEYFV